MTQIETDRMLGFMQSLPSPDLSCGMYVHYIIIANQLGFAALLCTAVKCWVESK